MAGKYLGFKKLESSLSQKPGISDPGALAAAIGKRKYGVARFNAAAAKGKSLKGAPTK
jgi:hypothetical protein